MIDQGRKGSRDAVVSCGSRLLSGASLTRRKGSSMQGTIARLVRNRGFGFIKDEYGTELFFHATSVGGTPYDDLTEGQAVSYDSEPDTRGRGERAVNVQAA
jgi:CspA family cold shock protein